jgi:hypothetical protein
MHRHCMTIALLGLFTSAPAWSAGDGDLWILPAAMACVAQYPSLSSTELGSKLVKAPQVVRQIDAARAAFATRPWEARSLCDELMHLDPKLRPADKAYFEKMRERHIDALSALQERIPGFWGPAATPRSR